VKDSFNYYSKKRESIKNIGMWKKYLRGISRIKRENYKKSSTGK
jgi:hypothetical protein